MKFHSHMLTMYIMCKFHVTTSFNWFELSPKNQYSKMQMVGQIWPWKPPKLLHMSCHDEDLITSLFLNLKCVKNKTSSTTKLTLKYIFQHMHIWIHDIWSNIYLAHSQNHVSLLHMSLHMGCKLLSHSHSINVKVISKMSVIQIKMVSLHIIFLTCSLTSKGLSTNRLLWNICLSLEWLTAEGNRLCQISCIWTAKCLHLSIQFQSICCTVQFGHSSVQSSHMHHYLQKK